MNEIVNKFLLAEERLMWEMYSRQPRFIYSACGPFTEKKKKKKRALMKILKIYLEEQLLIKYCMIKHLILQKSKIGWISKGSCFDGL